MEEKISGTVLTTAILSHLWELYALGTIRTAYGTPSQHPSGDDKWGRGCYSGCVFVTISHIFRPQEEAEGGRGRGGGVHISGGFGPFGADLGRHDQAPVKHHWQHCYGW